MFDIMFIAPKAEGNPRDSFESRLTDRLSARITVQTAARHELTRADAFTRTLSSAVRSISRRAFDFKRRCTEMVNVRHQRPREPFESIGSICSLSLSRYFDVIH